MATSNVNIQEFLETEYPLIDSSLLAALISDLPSPVDTTHESFQNLYQILSQLSLEADTQQQHADSDIRTHHVNGLATSASSIRLESEDLRESEHSGSSPDDLSLSASVISSRSTSVTSTTSCTTPLEFLRILFPHLSIATIEQALREYSGIDDDSLQPVDLALDDADMSALVDHLLNLEYIQDLTDRGLEDTDVESDAGTWCTVTRKGKQTPSRPKSKSRPHKYTMPLVDIRQRQHAPVTKAVAVPVPSFSGDPWTRFTSLATRLSELLHPTPPGFFTSYFHAPTSKGPSTKAGWKGEGDASRNALGDLIERSASPVDKTELDTAADVVCSILFNPEAEDVLTLDAEQRSRLVSDVRLCVAAARGDAATALDLVWLLRELDDAFDEGEGIAHSILGPVANERSPSGLANPGRRPVSTWATTLPPGTRAPTLALPTQPPPLPPPPPSQKHPPHVSSSKKDRGWTLVAPRQPAFNEHVHPHAKFIPAYSRAKRPVKGPGNRFGKGGKGDAGELDHGVEWYKARAGEVQMQRNEALREATRHWHGGNPKTRGGEVALYYAERARELQEQQRKWALGAARVMVEEKRTEPDMLDLHGLTVAEACVIVKEVIDASPPSPAMPLKIITGRGSHSVGRVGVLGPAVRDMLRGEGWIVGKWDGGFLVVRGKS